MATMDEKLNDLLDDLEDIQAGLGNEIAGAIRRLAAGESVTIGGRTFKLQEFAQIVLGLSDNTTQEQLVELITAEWGPKAAAQSQAATEKAMRSYSSTFKGVSGDSTGLQQIRETMSFQNAVRHQIGGDLRQRIEVRLNQARMAGTREAFIAATDQLIEDFKTGGPVFSDLRSPQVWKTQVSEPVGFSSDQTAVTMEVRSDNPRASDDQVNEAAAEERLQWVATLANTCGPCLGRHGEVDTFHGWLARGMPQGDWGNWCKQHCQCRLVPAQSKAPELKQDVAELVERTAETGVQRRERT